MQSHRSVFFLFSPLLWLLFCDWGGKLHPEADLLCTVSNWSPHELKKKQKVCNTESLKMYWKSMYCFEWLSKDLTKVSKMFKEIKELKL